MSFNGGHGTLAGLTPVLQQYGVGDLVNVGLGLATIGIVSGIVIGTTLVNYAIRSPSIPVVRQTPPSLTKTSTSIIICRAPTIGQWTSGKGWLK
jgi:glutamate:Na+ symporter, ESS family